ncbi:type II secretion system protein GspN [Anaeromyxobacter sp. SG66]|uniref:type II secretion system protein GspN n=1 Tax=Anaeromyxobacter sp. SG66 TaxID=2925410 RepID=UPI001F58AD16|nr:type II secretion system protein GspN [Anaeromyxobacter sp. SG66]
MTIDWNRWRPRLLYGAFTFAAFLLALRLTFPADAVKQRIVLEAAARGWQVDMADVGPGGIAGIHAEGVTVEAASGLKVPLDELTASLRLLPLLTGRRSVAFDARLYDGEVEGTADLSGDEREIALAARGVDLARALPLRKASGLDLTGKLSGKVALTVPAAPNGQPKGRIDVTVTEAGVNGGQLPVPGMTSGLALPKLGLGELVAAVKLDQGKATFEKLEARGGDADFTADGLYAVLQPRIEYAPISGKAKLKVKDAFWARRETQAFKGVAEAALASSRGRDGAWNFQIAGSVSRPQLRPVQGGQ